MGANPQGPETITGTFVRMSLAEARDRNLRFQPWQSDRFSMACDLCQLGVLDSRHVQVIAQENADGELTIVGWTGDGPVNREPLLALLRARRHQGQPLDTAAIPLGVGLPVQ